MAKNKETSKEAGIRTFCGRFMSAPFVFRPDGWSAQNLYPFDLGHKRLNQRAARIVQAALDHPGDSIPTAAGDRAATDAKHFGFFVHSALALREDGLPLGLLHQHVWMRPPEERGKRAQRRHKETADKESQRWLDTEQACVAALPDGRWLASAGEGSSVTLWNLGPACEPARVRACRTLKGQPARFLSGIAFTPDGLRLASAGDDGTVRLWDLRTDREVLLLTLPEREVNGMAFPPGSDRLIALTGGAVHVWDAIHPDVR